MSNLDPDAGFGAVNPEPSPPAATEPREPFRPPTTLAWWVAGVCGVVAVLAVVSLVANDNMAEQRVAVAAAQGHALGLTEGAQSAMNTAQASTQAAIQSAQNTAQSEADRAAAARAQAEIAADRAAVGADQQGRDASATTATPSVQP